ncbi:MAG: hypothetical protein COB04_16195 [Gammaproteobacteria bacterium]|nr:MAG: hypothetical protein COB04_16195 [Gammaproteobacteria bacterium]
MKVISDGTAFLTDGVLTGLKRVHADAFVGDLEGTQLDGKADVVAPTFTGPVGVTGDLAVTGVLTAPRLTALDALVATLAPLVAPTFTGPAAVTGDLNVTGVLTAPRLTALDALVATLAPLVTPTFTGPAAVTGDLNVTGVLTAPILTTMQEQIGLIPSHDDKAPIADPTFTGLVTLPTLLATNAAQIPTLNNVERINIGSSGAASIAAVGLDSIHLVAPDVKIDNLTGTNMNLKAPLANPTFTGATVVSGTLTGPTLTTIDGRLDAIEPWVGTGGLIDIDLENLEARMDDVEADKANVADTHMTGTADAVNLDVAGILEVGVSGEMRGPQLNYLATDIMDIQDGMAPKVTFVVEDSEIYFVGGIPSSNQAGVVASDMFGTATNPNIIGGRNVDLVLGGGNFGPGWISGTPVSVAISPSVRDVGISTVVYIPETVGVPFILDISNDILTGHEMVIVNASLQIHQLRLAPGRLWFRNLATPDAVLAQNQITAGRIWTVLFLPGMAIVKSAANTADYSI